MNKFILGLLTLLLVLPLFIYAQPISGPEGCKLKHDFSSAISSCTKDATISAESTASICCLLDAVSNVTDWVFYILAIIVSLMVIYGGFNIVTSAGDPKKMETGRKILTFALIGLVIALVAKFLPYVVIFFVGAK